jgi:glycosyltransferase involved in cell wall biosynthesis
MGSYRREKRMTTPLRFHLLGLAHIPTHPRYSPSALSQKVVKLSRMLRSLGHTVVFYGTEGSQVDCDEFVQVSTEGDRVRTYGDYDWRKEFFKHDPQDHAHQVFNANAMEAINQRKGERDFLLCPMGNYNKPVADKVGLMAVEHSVGYLGVFARYRVFQSYTWMMYIYGLLNQGNGSWYDAVIPNFYDPADFPYQGDKDDYYLFIGRLVSRKGVDVAVQVTREIGARLLIAGQGALQNPAEGLDIRGDHVQHVGTVGPQERAELMGRARAVFVPTRYIEPFGGVAVEAQMCGTPVITTDWGVFNETVVHGVTGWRCRTFDDFVWAATSGLGQIDPAACREWALRNYSVDRVKWMYQEYFGKLHDLWGRGWYERHPERAELDWLTRHYPASPHAYFPVAAEVFTYEHTAS